MYSLGVVSSHARPKYFPLYFSLSCPVTHMGAQQCDSLHFAVKGRAVGIDAFVGFVFCLFVFRNCPAVFENDKQAIFRVVLIREKSLKSLKSGLT